MAAILYHPPADMYHAAQFKGGERAPGWARRYLSGLRLETRRADYSLSPGPSKLDLRYLRHGVLRCSWAGTSRCARSTRRQVQEQGRVPRRKAASSI